MQRQFNRLRICTRLTPAAATAFACALVTSGISPEEMKDEIVKRLAAAEEMNENGELGFAFTFDYTSKKIYMIFSNQMDYLEQCVKEQYLEPLNAKRQQRAEALEKMKQGREQIAMRKAEL